MADMKRQIRSATPDSTVEALISEAKVPLHPPTSETITKTEEAQVKALLKGKLEVKGGSQHE